MFTVIGSFVKIGADGHTHTEITAPNAFMLVLCR